MSPEVPAGEGGGGKSDHGAIKQKKEVSTILKGLKSITRA